MKARGHSISATRAEQRQQHQCTDHGNDDRPETANAVGVEAEHALLTPYRAGGRRQNLSNWSTWRGRPSRTSGTHPRRPSSWHRLKWRRTLWRKPRKRWRRLGISGWRKHRRGPRSAKPPRTSPRSRGNWPTWPYARAFRWPPSSRSDGRRHRTRAGNRSRPRRTDCSSRGSSSHGRRGRLRPTCRPLRTVLSKTLRLHGGKSGQRQASTREFTAFHDEAPFVARRPNGADDFGRCQKSQPRQKARMMMIGSGRPMSQPRRAYLTLPPRLG